MPCAPSTFHLLAPFPTGIATGMSPFGTYTVCITALGKVSVKEKGPFIPFPSTDLLVCIKKEAFNKSKFKGSYEWKVISIHYFSNKVILARRRKW